MRGLEALRFLERIFGFVKDNDDDPVAPVREARPARKGRTARTGKPARTAREGNRPRYPIAPDPTTPDEMTDE